MNVMRDEQLRDAYEQLSSLLRQLEGTSVEVNLLRAKLKLYLELQRRKGRRKAADRGKSAFRRSATNDGRRRAAFDAVSVMETVGANCNRLAGKYLAEGQKS